MVPIRLMFSDFESYENYLSLQNTFVSKDANHESQYDFESIQEKLVIKRPEFGDVHMLFNPDKSELVEIDFFEDFLPKEIPKMTQGMIDFMQRMLANKDLFSEHDIQGFFSRNLEQFNRLFKLYETASYLSLEIKGLLFTVLHELVSYCEARVKDPFPEIKHRIQVKCKRIDIEAFFYLLREHRVIEYISDADLGRIIDGIFDYEASSGSRKYKEISGSASKITDINNYVRNIDPSISRLHKIFNNDFFSNNMG